MCICALSIAILSQNQFSIETLSQDYKNGVFQFFCMADIDENDMNAISVGYGSIVTCDAVEVYKVKSKLKNIQGESYSFNKDDFDVDLFLQKYGIKTVKKQDLGEIEIVYGYLDKLSKFVVENEKINLEIAVNGNHITVGYPLIMGSY